MNIRSVDLQVLIPRATDVSKTQQIADHQSSLQQQQFAEQWQQISAKRQQQVQSTAKSEGGKVQNEKKEQGKQKGHKHHQQDELLDITDDETANHASLEDPVRGHTIDIKT